MTAVVRRTREGLPEAGVEAAVAPSSEYVRARRGHECGGSVQCRRSRAPGVHQSATPVARACGKGFALPLLIWLLVPSPTCLRARHRNPLCFSPRRTVARVRAGKEFKHQ